MFIRKCVNISLLSWMLLVAMDGKTSVVLTLIISAVFAETWRSSAEERQQVRNLRQGLHSHTKRHMLPEMDARQEIRADTRPLEASKRRVASPRNRKKPAGHLAPLHDDDMDNDEVVSVAIGPPPMRPKYDKINWKHPPKGKIGQAAPASNCTQGAANLVQDVLTQLGREFLTRQVSEDFIFGQYIGSAMKNITGDLKLKMQHEILDLVVRYQKLNHGETSPPSSPPPMKTETQTFKGDVRTEKKTSGNDTDDTWPDFTNLAKIVG